jgi:hypothetical protein
MWEVRPTGESDGMRVSENGTRFVLHVDVTGGCVDDSEAELYKW